MRFLFFLFLISVTFDKPAIANDVVELSEGIHNGANQLVGRLDLGEVRAGELIEKEFSIKNLSRRAVQFTTVKPSCSCTTVRIPSEVVEGGGRSKSNSRVAIKIPKLMGKRARLAEVTIGSDDRSIPVATIEVVADVIRPFNFSSMRQAFYVKVDSEYELDLGLEIAAGTDPLELELGHTAKDLMLQLKDGRLYAKGLGKSAINESPVTVQVKYEENGWEIEDVIVLDFYDNGKARISPTSFEKADASAMCMILCRDGIDFNRFAVIDDFGNAVKFEVRSKSDGFVRIAIAPTSIPGDNIHFSDGRFKVSATLH